jgi:hypothetical protein
MGNNHILLMIALLYEIDRLLFITLIAPLRDLLHGKRIVDRERELSGEIEG